MSDQSGYALGYSSSEHDRLARQGERLRPLTERFLRDAGVREADRVLDVGSGIGDVAMLAAQIVGSDGEVVGIERDLRSIERARARAAAASHTNISFLEADVGVIPPCGTFDAVIGRFVLQFVRDPLGALRSLRSFLRPGGIVAFQEVSYAPSLALVQHLPLWSRCATTVRDAMRRSGANPEIGNTLYRLFVDAGFPEPTVAAGMQIGSNSEFVLWPYDLLRSLRSSASTDSLVDPLGDIATLADRLRDEVASAQSAVPSVTVVGAWAKSA